MPRLLLAIVIALVTLVASAADAASAPPRATRLRPQSPRIADWLSRGRDTSPTLRRLAEQIERSDVIVYLEVERALRRDLAACVTWMAAVAGARYVRVSIRPSLSSADAIAMLAHELQHVVEIIDHREVQSGDALLALYRVIGHRTGWTDRAFDTVAALRAGDLARLELASGA